MQWGFKNLGTKANFYFNLKENDGFLKILSKKISFLVISHERSENFFCKQHIFQHDSAPCHITKTVGKF